MKTLLIATLVLGAGAAAQAVANDDAQVRLGEYLARAGDCVACHLSLIHI